jgi:ABC-2 type transport system permease protein
MTNQIAAEVRKLRTTRTLWGLLAGLVVLVGASVLEMVLNIPADEFDMTRLEASALAAPTALIITVFAVVAGARSFTDEFRFGTIVPTLLATPARLRVLAGKLVALAMVGCVFALAAGAVALGLTWIFVDGFAVSTSFGEAGIWIVELAAVAIAWTAIGAGLGLAIKHQVAAIVGSLVWITIGDGLLGTLVPDAARFLPSAAGRALASVEAGQLDTFYAALVLLAWVTAVVGMGTAFMRRRDIAGD